MSPGLLLIALAAVSWGTTGATMKTLAAEAAAGPLFVGFMRVAVAAPVLVVVAQSLGRPWPRWRLCAPVALVAGICMAGFQIGYFSAVTRVGVALTALIAICSAPIMIAVLSVIFLGERLTPRVLLALGLGIAGTGLLLLGPGGVQAAGGEFLLGSLLALGAGLSYAVYAVVAKRVMEKIHPLQLAAMTFVVAAILLSPAPAGQAELGATFSEGWPLLLYLGLVPSALGYILFNTGLRTTGATVASIVTLLEPLTASILGLTLFDERLGLLGATGAAILVAAIVVLARNRVASTTLEVR
ncbi:MAG: DMT family transporter [Actinomycetota bacterium]